jgi:PhnB protein
MEMRPYITFKGTCSEAVELYKRAFQTDTINFMRFSDMPNCQVPDECKNYVLQATLRFGDNFIRMSDCGPSQTLNDAETEKIAIVVEASVEETKRAFAVLAEKGRVGMALAETFYSPCAGVVFDCFGVMWNLAAKQG